MLPDGEVHVWRASLDSAPDECELVLDGAERERADRFHGEQVRRRWIASHAFLRGVVAGYLGSNPDAVEFDIDEHDKPHVSGSADVRFNLSHAGGWALVAVARELDVGVDLESMDHSGDLVAIAHRALPPAVASEIERTPAPERESRFFRAWARHEARGKCLGQGVTEPTDAVAPLHEPWVADLDVAPQVAAALAVSSEPADVLLLDWGWSSS